MNRPTGMAERRTALEARRVAATRAALAARRAEQAAAARRRLVLTSALAAVTALGWVASAIWGFTVLPAALLSAALVGVLYLGIRTARAEREEWARVPRSLLEPRPAAPGGPTFSAAQLRSRLPEGGAVPDGDARELAERTSVGAAAREAVPDGGRGTCDVDPGSGAGQGGRGLRWSTDHAAAGAAVSSSPEGDEGGDRASDARPGTWTPVPVPVPAYTLKAAAPRRETVQAGESARAGSDAEVAQVRAAAAQALEAGSDTVGAPNEGEIGGGTADEPGIDLNAVLARRRAVGA